MLAGFGIVEFQFFLSFQYVFKVCKGEVADLTKRQVLRDHNNTTFTIVMAQAGTVGYIRILHFNRYGFRIISRLIIHHHLDGDRCKALRLSSYHTIFGYLNDIFIAGLIHNRGVIGEESIQIICQTDSFRRIHSQIILIVEEPGIAGISNQLILTVNHIISLQSFVAGECKHICYRLIIATISFILLIQHRHLKGHTLICSRIANLNIGTTGSTGNQLIIHNTNNAGSGGSDLKQFTPLCSRIHQWCQRVNFVGTHG